MQGIVRPLAFYKTELRRSHRVKADQTASGMYHAPPYGEIEDDPGIRPAPPPICSKTPYNEEAAESFLFASLNEGQRGETPQSRSNFHFE